MIGIYKITNPIGQVYIGQSINIKSRRFAYSGICSGSSKKLKNSVSIYGIQNHKFEIIEECEVIDLNRRERHYQLKYDSFSNNGLNIKLTSDTDKVLPSSKEVILLYGEKTVQVNYRVPESKKDEINAEINKILSSYIDIKRVRIPITPLK